MFIYHSPLEGESARQGRQPAVAPVGGGRQPFIRGSFLPIPNPVHPCSIPLSPFLISSLLPLGEGGAKCRVRVATHYLIRALGRFPLFALLCALCESLFLDAGCLMLVRDLGAYVVFVANFPIPSLLIPNS